ncbi:MAG: DUF4087 domain-containing protein [Paracoccaceae bacterium]
MFRLPFTFAILLLTPIGTLAETRCGWLDNPTPANYWLTDADGEWLMEVQGGYSAEGMDDLPDYGAGGWVETNGSYGYGCACLDLDVDHATGLVIRIRSLAPLPLEKCWSDPALPKRVLR